MKQKTKVRAIIKISPKGLECQQVLFDCCKSTEKALMKQVVLKSTERAVCINTYLEDILGFSN